MRWLPVACLLLMVFWGLGCQRGAPASKVELMDRVVEALQAADEAAFRRLLLEPAELPALCPARDPATREALATRLAADREKALESFRDCLALVDWSAARRLALNLGRRANRKDAACRPEWHELESAELFLGVGERVYKVKVARPYALGGRFGLQRRIRCSAKPAPQTPERWLALDRGCPHPRWNRVVQADCAQLGGTP